MRYTSVSKRLLPFRTQILFGFSAFLLVIIFWIALFFRNEKRRDDWMDFKAALQSSQQSYLEKSYRLQNSLLIGYRQPEFYLDRSEANIQSFLNNQRSLYNALENLRQDALRRGLGLDSAFLNLIEANAVLADSVRLMRELQYEKRYKDYGLIGKMREKPTGWKTAPRWLWPISCNCEGTRKTFSCGEKSSMCRSLKTDRAVAGPACPAKTAQSNC
jgi:hypothetical protein